jgi:hypothetical protein
MKGFNYEFAWLGSRDFSRNSRNFTRGRLFHCDPVLPSQPIIHVCWRGNVSWGAGTDRWRRSAIPRNWLWRLLDDEAPPQNGLIFRLQALIGPPRLAAFFVRAVFREGRIGATLGRYRPLPPLHALRRSRERKSDPPSRQAAPTHGWPAAG